MPKFQKIQTNFNAGEVSQNVQGRVDSERYDTALDTCQNYIPILQGPLIRRSGTKYVGQVKDSTKPPVLVPFTSSDNTSYVLEFGDFYVRFYTNDSQVLTSGSSIQLINSTFDQLYCPKGANLTYGLTYSVRDNTNLGATESLFFQSSYAPQGSVLELQSPYGIGDISRLKWTQKEDVLYLVHPNFRPYKLQRANAQVWNLIPQLLKDGPYLPFNTRDTLADSATTWIKINSSLSQSGQIKPGAGIVVDLLSGSSYQVLNYSSNGDGYTRLTLNNTFNLTTGDQVSIRDVVSTTNINNDFGNNNPNFWTITVIGNSTASINCEFGGGSFTQSGTLAPYLFKPTDAGRLFALADNGSRFWGIITNSAGGNGCRVRAILSTPMPDDNINKIWQLGAFTNSSWPATAVFHQNRLFYAGSPNLSEEIDASVVGIYDAFQASGSTFQVADNNALQFNLLTSKMSPVQWIQSASQGLLAGAVSSEWVVSPNTQAGALTPTNFSANQAASFGASNAQPVQLGTAVVYIQNGQHRIREMNYFFQAGSFRSTNLSELSEHITLPAVTQLAVQKEPHPVVWGLRQDGQLLSLTYNRDDVTLKSGFARHVLGGQSDGAGSAPVVKSIAIANASSALHEELWMTVSRYIQSTAIISVEYMTRTFADNSNQEDAYYLDCGTTVEAPLPITAISRATSCVVTSPGHGLTNSTVVRFATVVGLNSSYTNADGVTSIFNLLNGSTFMVASSSVNSFKIQDFLGNDINSTTYTSYLGSGVVRKMVSSVSGLNWLKGENISILADGAIHPNVTVNSAGVATLAFPAAKVQAGYSYNSDAKLLRTKDGSAQGTAIGATRRCNRVAFLVHNVGELNVGASFTDMYPVELFRATAMTADQRLPIVDGIIREFFKGEYTFTDAVCFRQSAPLPGTIQAVVRFVEEQDV